MFSTVLSTLGCIILPHQIVTPTLNILRTDKALSREVTIGKAMGARSGKQTVLGTKQKDSVQEAECLRDSRGKGCATHYTNPHHSGYGHHNPP